VLEIVEREAFGVGVDMWANPLLCWCALLLDVGAVSGIHLAAVVHSQRVTLLMWSVSIGQLGGKSAGASVAWLRLGEGFWMAIFNHPPDRGKHHSCKACASRLGFSGSSCSHLMGDWYSALLVWVTMGREFATCTLRMLTSRRWAQAHANGSKHPVLIDGPRSLTYVRVSGCEKPSVRNESEGGHLGH